MLHVAANLLQLPDGDVQLLDFFVFLSAQPDDVTATRVSARRNGTKEPREHGLKKNKVAFKIQNEMARDKQMQGRDGHKSRVSAFHSRMRLLCCVHGTPAPRG